MKTLFVPLIVLAVVSASQAAPSSAGASSVPPAAAPAAVAPAPATDGTIRVEKIAVGTAIDMRELTGAADSFPASVTRVYCWTKVSGAKGASEIRHVWYADGKKEAEVVLPIKTESARTWSSKTVWPGKWKVEVLGSSGEGEISSIEFEVK